MVWIWESSWLKWSEFWNFRDSNVPNSGISWFKCFQIRKSSWFKWSKFSTFRASTGLGCCKSPCLKFRNVCWKSFRKSTEEFKNISDHIQKRIRKTCSERNFKSLKTPFWNSSNCFLKYFWNVYEMICANFQNFCSEISSEHCFESFLNMLLKDFSEGFNGSVQKCVQKHFRTLSFGTKTFSKIKNCSEAVLNIFRNVSENNSETNSTFVHPQKETFLKHTKSVQNSETLEFLFRNLLKRFWICLEKPETILNIFWGCFWMFGTWGTDFCNTL